MTSSKRTTGRVIGEVVTKRVADGVSIEIPATAGVQEGNQFLLIKKDDGNLILKAPNENGTWSIDEIKRELTNDDPETNGYFDDIDFRKELADLGIVDIEDERPEHS